MVVEWQTIPHLNALVNRSQILGQQLCSLLRGCQTTSSLKCVFFKRKVAWSSLIRLHDYSWDILEPTSRELKWGIFWLSRISGSLSNPLFTKYSNPLVWYFRSVVYIIGKPCWHWNSWKRRAGHYQGLAMPTVCEKCTFLEKRVWQVHKVARPLSF